MSQNLAVKENLMSEAEYLAFEEKSKIKHEFMDGEIFSMAGGKRYHSLTISNIARHLGNQLEGSRAKLIRAICALELNRRITFIQMSSSLAI